MIIKGQEHNLFTMVTYGPLIMSEKGNEVETSQKEKRDF